MTLRVPDTLAGGSEKLEVLFERLQSIKCDRQLVLDFSGVHWIRPSGLIALVIFVRMACQQTGRRIRLVGCRPDILAYLERVDCFSRCAEWLYTPDEVPLPQHLSRSESSTGLLELQPISSAADVRHVADRSEQIIKQWLRWGSTDQ